MDVGQALRWVAGRLAGAAAGRDLAGPASGGPALSRATVEAAVEAEILVGHVAGQRRGGLYAHPERLLSTQQQRHLEGLVARRMAGEPLQYLTGQQAFRTLELVVGPGVLVPRPETEIVVEHALGRIAGVASPLVVDVGTGSGAIALSIAAERPDAQVWATEISPAAALWAQRNLIALQDSNVTLLAGDLLSPLPARLRGSCDLVVANPPYLSDAELAQAPVDVRDHEPRQALVSGPTGREVPTRLTAEALAWLKPGGWLVMEIAPAQAPALSALLSAAYSAVAVHADLTGRPRVAEGRRPGSPPG